MMTHPFLIVTSLCSLLWVSSCFTQEVPEATPREAVAVKSLPGYVQSPYTEPPLLVDVRGSVAGDAAICPYTQRAFIIPADFVESEMGTPKTGNEVTFEDVTDLLKAGSNPEEIILELQKSGYVGDTDAGALLKLKKAGATALLLAAVKREAEITARASTPQSPVGELPYGEAVPGRPGFVTSPYAAKHQIVDVTGLPVGMEVKCPYSGKLFRVPPQP